MLSHRMTHTPEYKSWSKMRQRCNDPNNNRYYRYGARGIKVCKRWQDSFGAFYEDLGPKPPGCSVDRIDNDGDYEPSNCRWATVNEQSKNRSTTVKYKGECMKDWATKLGVPYHAFAWRVKKYGWSNALSYNNAEKLNG